MPKLASSTLIQKPSFSNMAAFWLQLKQKSNWPFENHGCAIDVNVVPERLERVKYFERHGSVLLNLTAGHGNTQYSIDTGLPARPGCLERVQYININPHC